MSNIFINVFTTPFFRVAHLTTKERKAFCHIKHYNCETHSKIYCLPNVDYVVEGIKSISFVTRTILVCVYFPQKLHNSIQQHNVTFWWTQALLLFIFIPWISIYLIFVIKQSKLFTNTKKNTFPTIWLLYLEISCLVP